jgi:hypothetical protein
LFSVTHAEDIPIIPYKTALRLSLHGEVYEGYGVFDFEPYFPCSAFFLDTAYALLLKISDENTQKYLRIGLARFSSSPDEPRIRTKGSVSEDEPWDVIGPEEKRTVITIV